MTRRATLTVALLANADLTWVNLTGADLRGADFTGSDLTSARYNTHTLWPKGFNPLKRGALLER